MNILKCLLYIKKINKLLSFFLLIAVIFTSHALAFQDKKGREISLEGDVVLNDQDKAISHKSYLPHKEYYERLNIKYKVFFDNFHKSISDELKSEGQIPIVL